MKRWFGRLVADLAVGRATDAWRTHSQSHGVIGGGVTRTLASMRNEVVQFSLLRWRSLMTMMTSLRWVEALRCSGCLAPPSAPGACRARVRPGLREIPPGGKSTGSRAVRWRIRVRSQ